MASAPPTIDSLLRLVPDKPETVLTQLRSTADAASLAAKADANGYTLVHAAASYGQLDLLRTLVQEYKCDVNVRDDEGETPLFYAETLAAARCLVEELSADVTLQNEEEATAEENAETNAEDGDGAEWAAVADFLRQHRTGTKAGDQAQKIPSAVRSAELGSILGTPARAGSADELHAPPPLPPGVKINVGTVQEVAEGDEGAPDPEFRRQIEELAARDDFQGEAGQAELKRLVTEALGGMALHGSETKSRRTE